MKSVTSFRFENLYRFLRARKNFARDSRSGPSQADESAAREHFSSALISALERNALSETILTMREIAAPIQPLPHARKF